MSTLHAAELSASTDLLGFIEASPTPFHAVASAALRLSEAGFKPLLLSQSFEPLAPGRYYVQAGDSTILAFAVSEAVKMHGLRGFRIIGAHTDSPNLRLKPKAIFEKAGYIQLAVEVYGGALLNSWLDRDLYLAGRVVYRDDNERLLRRLVRLPQPLLRVAQLAIHLDREINEKGLALNRQDHLAPIVSLAGGERKHNGDELLRTLCADAAGLKAESIVTMELMLADAAPPARGGLDGDLLFAPRLDNLAMCHAALEALIRASSDKQLQDELPVIPIVALFDHEEVGSGSAYGAQAPLLPGVLERIVLGLGLERPREAYLQALSGSLCVSADMAHAVHPNYAERHDAHHRPLPNGGPVIKANAQQRYATCGRTAALFTELCRKEDVAVQHYVHRTDLPCGSTIGPITATQLGIPTVDVGNAMLSMHSARELAGARDPERMNRVLGRFLRFVEMV